MHPTQFLTLFSGKNKQSDYLHSGRQKRDKKPFSICKGSDYADGSESTGERGKTKYEVISLPGSTQIKKSQGYKLVFRRYSFFYRHSK